MPRVAIAGSGRMGTSISAQLDRDPALTCAGVWRRGGDLDALLSVADVLIDFSLPDGTEQVLEALNRNPLPLVCGVSGLGERQLAALRVASESLPIVYDRNMSPGIAVLTRLVRDAAAALSASFDARISEVHHIHKKDAPSGTALKLGEAVAEARGEPRTGSVKFASERRGDVPGDHEVVLTSAVEELRFSHSVTTRDVFADGAIRAARWVVRQAPGLYDMHDVLFGGGDSRKAAKKTHG